MMFICSVGSEKAEVVLKLLFQIENWTIETMTLPIGKKVKRKPLSSKFNWHVNYLTKHIHFLYQQVLFGSSVLQKCGPASILQTIKTCM